MQPLLTSATVPMNPSTCLHVRMHIFPIMLPRNLSRDGVTMPCVHCIQSHRQPVMHSCGCHCAHRCRHACIPRRMLTRNLASSPMQYHAAVPMKAHEAMRMPTCIVPLLQHCRQAHIPLMQSTVMLDLPSRRPCISCAPQSAVPPTCRHSITLRPTAWLSFPCTVTAPTAYAIQCIAYGCRQ